MVGGEEDRSVDVGEVPRIRRTCSDYDINQSKLGWSCWWFDANPGDTRTRQSRARNADAANARRGHSGPRHAPLFHGRFAPSVHLPQFVAVRPIVGPKEQRSIDVGQNIWIRADCRRLDIFGEGCSVGGPVAFPQLVAERSVIGPKEQRSIDVCQIGWS